MCDLANPCPIFRHIFDPNYCLLTKRWWAPMTLRDRSACSVGRFSEEPPSVYTEWTMIYNNQGPSYIFRPLKGTSGGLRQCPSILGEWTTSWPEAGFRRWHPRAISVAIFPLWVQSPVEVDSIHELHGLLITAHWGLVLITLGCPLLFYNPSPS